MIELCSYCHQDRMNCHCEQFHPNITVIDGVVLNKSDAEHLYAFLLKCGYISYDEWPEIHNLFSRLRKELNK